MKLRFRANTLRLRLNQTEVASLSQNHPLKERVDFPGNTALQYTLSVGDTVEASATFVNGNISIELPENSVHEWSTSATIGLYFNLPVTDNILKIAVEKDLVCIDGPPEEIDPDAYPRPNEQANC